MAWVKINDKRNLKNSFILSKGHAAPALYVVLKEKIIFLKNCLRRIVNQGVFRGTSK